MNNLKKIVLAEDNSTLSLLLKFRLEKEGYQYAKATMFKTVCSDLSDLADGEYTFVVETGKDKLTKEFVIKTQTFRGITLASNR